MSPHFRILFQYDSLKAAIYECDWHSAPVAFKRVLLLFMTQCSEPVGIDARSFYAQLNLALFGRVSLANSVGNSDTLIGCQS